MADPREWFPEQWIAVFPLRRQSKEPACQWATYSGPVPRTGNYGVRLGVGSDGAHLCVMDEDSLEAGAWIATATRSGLLPPTPFRVTTGRGTHHYYRSTRGALPRFIYPAVPTEADPLAVLKIEIKSDGQYVVGPGSIHPSGSVYAASEWSWAWRDLPLLPDAVLDLDERVSAPQDGDPYEFPAEVREPGRHDELFKLLRAHKARGDDRAATREVVSLANQNRCKPPIREDAVFDAWFARAWTLRDRPLIDIEGDSLGLNTPIEDA